MSLYLGLGYYDPAAYDRLSAEDRSALAARCRPHDEKFNGTGKVKHVATLDHGTWAHVRPTATGPSVTDGPFTEAKEIVGSYFIVEADSFEEAVDILSLHPASQIGAEFGFSMEVRPIEKVWVQDGEFVGG